VRSTWRSALRAGQHIGQRENTSGKFVGGVHLWPAQPRIIRASRSGRNQERASAPSVAPSAPPPSAPANFTAARFPAGFCAGSCRFKFQIAGRNAIRFLARSACFCPAITPPLAEGGLAGQRTRVICGPQAPDFIPHYQTAFCRMQYHLNLTNPPRPLEYNYQKVCF